MHVLLLALRLWLESNIDALLGRGSALDWDGAVSIAELILDDWEG